MYSPLRQVQIQVWIHPYRQIVLTGFGLVLHVPCLEPSSHGKVWVDDIDGEDGKSTRAGLRAKRNV